MSQSRYGKVIAFLDIFLQVFTGILVAVLLCIIMAGVVFRAMNEPLSWTDEISGFLMVWLACLGWMIATRKGTHIRIQLFQNMMPTVAWRGFEIISQIAVAVIGGVMAWYSLHLMKVNSDIEAMSLPVSVAWMYVPLLPAGLLTIVQAFADMLKSRPAATDVEGA